MRPQTSPWGHRTPRGMCIFQGSDSHATPSSSLSNRCGSPDPAASKNAWAYSCESRNQYNPGRARWCRRGATAWYCFPRLRKGHRRWPQDREVPPGRGPPECLRRSNVGAPPGRRAARQGNRHPPPGPPRRAGPMPGWWPAEYRIGRLPEPRRQALMCGQVRARPTQDVGSSPHMSRLPRGSKPQEPCT